MARREGNWRSRCRHIPQSPIAPIEITDFVYCKLIEISHAALYSETLIDGEKGLLRAARETKHQQAEAGRIMGIDQSDVSRLLKGRLRMFSIRTPVSVSKRLWC
ncbi:MAG: XRE family transcriptional regulator [Chloracidobacterium sp.]|nr:XRE family transcriptional regulator [Chloracidobacterium sp.]